MVDGPIFRGVGVALVTCFGDDGQLDVHATVSHAERLVGLGVQAVLVAGTTGEAAALDRGERGLLVEKVRAALPPTTPVLAGTGAPAARDAAAMTAEASERGADAALVLSPPRVADPRRYYETVAGAAPGFPLLAYHYPHVSPPGVPLGILDDLPVHGLKDSEGSPERLLAEVTGYAGEVYVGAAPLLALAGPVGATGAILALANAEPADCVAAFDGDPEAQRRLLSPHQAAQSSFPHGLKRLVADRFGTPTEARLG